MKSLQLGALRLSDPYRAHRYRVMIENETEEERQARLLDIRNRMRAHRARVRAEETEEERQARLAKQRAYHANWRRRNENK